MTQPESQARRWARVAAVGVAAGIAGWGLERVLFKTPRSFVGGRVPFLPAWGIGGAFVAATAPALRGAGLPWLLRGASYAVLLTGLEATACAIDRKLLGGSNEGGSPDYAERSWDYSDGEDPAPHGGCVDERAALAFGALGLLVEKLVP